MRLLRAERGQIDADLGAGLIKQRVARPGAGKSGGFRTLVFFRAQTRAVFAFGFAKSDMANLDAGDEAYMKKAAKLVLGFTDAQMKAEVDAGRMLGPVDKVWQPYLCGCQGEECREGFSCLVVSGRDAPELLETVEHPLDAVSIFVNPKVAGRRVLSVGFWRNDRPDTVDQEFFTQEVTVVAFVGEEQPRLADRYRQQVRNGVVVRSLAACQDEAKRAALTVCSGVDFRRKAAA